MHSFWQSLGPSTKSRLSMLTPKMMGDRSTPEFKAKAAETGECVPWACDFMKRNAANLEFGNELLAAGLALLEWKTLMANAEDRLNPIEVSRGIELSVRHNTILLSAGYELLPKHHLWVHMNLRLEWCGHPRTYSCWVDESLNSVLSACCQSSHKLTWEASVFDRIRLIPQVQKHSFFFKAGLKLLDCWAWCRC